MSTEFQNLSISSSKQATCSTPWAYAKTWSVPDSSYDFVDLRPLFCGYFDTTTGSKQDSGSYRKITVEIGVDAGEILLLSDSVGQLDAAREAGMQTTRLVRNEQDTDGSRHPVCDNFSGICI